MQNYISANLRYLRKTKKISQTELCDGVKVTSATISNWERGKSEPTASQLIQLSQLFEVSISDLIGSDLSELPEPSPETKEPKSRYLLKLFLPPAGTPQRHLHAQIHWLRLSGRL